MSKIKIGNKLIQFQLREDRAVLISCIGIALFFWLLVKLSQTYRTEKEVVLHYLLPQAKTTVEKPPETIIAQIEGNGWDLMFDFFSNANLELFYDLRNTASRISIGRGQLRTDISGKLSSNDIQVLEVNYDLIQLELEDKVEKTVPIDLKLALEFAPGHDRLDSIRFSPDSVNLTGPVSKISQITIWPTDSLVLKEVKNAVQQPLSLKDPSGEIELSIQEVALDIQVEPYTEKEFFVPITVINVPDSIKIFPERIKLTCVVGLSNYNSIGKNDFVVEADLGKASPKSDRNTVPILLTKQPEQVKSVFYSPKSVEYFFLQ